VTRIAISGHRGFSQATARLIDEAIRTEIAQIAGDGKLVGLSCLADGADQLFAQAVLDANGKLEVVIPAAKYRDGLPDEAKPAYDALLARANETHQLDHVESDEQAHMDASVEMIRRADLLFAVWDGRPARGFGGTADVVDHAKRIGLPVTVIWPEGAVRD
jgi:hypothetical protein